MQRYHQILKDCDQIMRLIIPLVKYIIFNILELEFEYPLVEIWCQTIGKSVFWLSWKVALRDFALILFETTEVF